MANIKSAEKRIRQAARRVLRNRAVRTKLRGAIKKYRQSEDSSKAGELPAAYAQIDIARRKGVIHKNAAARYKSRLAKKAAKKT
jgi:small subunit ribosomal protein S20